MIAPVMVKAGIAVGVVGELAAVAIAQATTVDTTAVWVAGIGFLGLIITSILTYVGQRAAAKEQRDAARELRQSAALQVARVEEIHTLVNNKSDVQAELIKEARVEVARLNALLLAKAEASPGVKPDPNEEK